MRQCGSIYRDLVSKEKKRRKEGRKEGRKEERKEDLEDNVHSVEEWLEVSLGRLGNQS